MPLPTQPDMHELIEEALYLLVEIDARAAAAFYLLHVAENSEEEVAKQFGTTDRNIRRWINGGTQHGQYVLGAKDLLHNIVTLFVEAHRCDGLTAVRVAFRFATHTNPSGTPFPAALLAIFWEAMDAGVLPRLLNRLMAAQRDNTYGQVMRDLLEHYDQGRLSCLFEAR